MSQFRYQKLEIEECVYNIVVQSETQTQIQEEDILRGFIERERGSPVQKTRGQQGMAGLSGAGRVHGGRLAWAGWWQQVVSKVESGQAGE